MKPSKFNVVVPDFPTHDESLIFNTFTDSRVIVNKKVREVMERGSDERLLTAEEKASLEQLKELGIMVDDHQDEDVDLEYWFQRLKFDSSVLDITLLTTSACNLGCVYCFEDGINLKGFLTEEICHQVIGWVSHKMDEVRPKILRLALFGGEPLLNIPAVKFVSKGLFESACQRGVEQWIDLITNGVLLTEEVVDFLTPLGLKRIKVTIDGDEAAHDSKRHYRGGKGTFRTIINNLLKIKGKAPLSIGGNFDDSTKASIPRLLDFLKEIGLAEHIRDVNFKPILTTLGNNSLDSGCACTFSDIDVHDFIWWREEAEKRGFKTKGGIALGPCCATKEQTYTIDPWGKIYKCPALVGREEFVIGDISHGVETYKNARFMSADLWRHPHCTGCPYIPVCDGGCRGSAVVQTGRYDGIACEKKYFETVGVELVKREVLQSLSREEVRRDEDSDCQERGEQEEDLETVVL